MLRIPTEVTPTFNELHDTFLFWIDRTTLVSLELAITPVSLVGSSERGGKDFGISTSKRRNFVTRQPFRLIFRIQLAYIL